MNILLKWTIVLDSNGNVITQIIQAVTDSNGIAATGEFVFTFVIDYIKMKIFKDFI